MAAPGYGNPAVVGLAGFGTTTLLLQFHNLGWMGTGVVFCTALMFGGLAQLIAGLQEFRTGSNFGYSAFSSYGAFWLALGFIFLILDLQGAPNTFVGGHLKIAGTDVGWFLVAFTIYTGIMFIGSLAIHTAMVLTFLTLLLGFIGLDLVFLADAKGLLAITAWDLVICALLAYYMMAHVIFLQVYGRDILPVGKPWVKKPA
jgi:succinate-acetate transporter protein